MDAPGIQLAYAILGALASGLAITLIPLVVTNSGGSSDRFGYESVNFFAAAGALLSLLCILPLRWMDGRDDRDAPLL